MMFSDAVRSPLVSVIVPVYNAGEHLLPCVRSILRQTYSNIEVILVDDGSTDGSAKLCDELAIEDSRVRVRHQANGGIGAAQNTGLDMTNGELVTFCDNDDLVSPYLVERLVGLLLATSADMACCRWRNVGASEGEMELARAPFLTPGRFVTFANPGRDYQLVFSLALRVLLRLELRYFSEANWGKLYRAALFDGLRFREGHYAQDVALAMPLYMRMSRVASCADPLYFWLQRGDSVSHSERGAAYYSDIVSAHLASFDAARRQGILPARAYSGLKALRRQKRAVSSHDEAIRYRADRAEVKRRIRSLGWVKRSLCELMHLERRVEVLVYDLTVHRRR